MQPPVFIPSAAAVPGAPMPTHVDPGIRNIGITSLVLALLQIIWGLFQIATSVASLPMLQMQKRTIASSTSGPPPAEYLQMMDRMQEHVITLALWGSIRQLLYMIASAFLLYLAARLMRGDPKALPLARSWSWAALTAIGISVLIQAAVVLPAQLDYQNQMFDSVPGGVPGSPGMASGFEAATSIWAVVMLVVGAAIMAVWPIVLRMWADKAHEKYRRVESVE